MDVLPSIAEPDPQALADELELLRREVNELRPLKQEVADLRAELAAHVAVADALHDGAFSNSAPARRRVILRVLKGGRGAALGGGVALLIIGGLFMPRFTAIFDPTAVVAAAQSVPVPGAQPPEQTHLGRRGEAPKAVDEPPEVPAPLPGSHLDRVILELAS